MLSGKFVPLATAFVVVALGASVVGHLDATDVSMPRARIVTLLALVLAIVALAV